MNSNTPFVWPNAAGTRFLNQQAVRWHLHIAGPELTKPDTPTVLLLHGTGGSAHQWADVLPALARHARVVAPDLPGHGLSSIQETARERTAGGSGDGGAPSANERSVPDQRAHVLSLPGMAHAVGELMRELALVPDVIVGHSAGAAVALRMTLDGLAKPRTVIGLNPALIPPPDIWVDLLAPFAGVLVESSWLSRSAAWIAGRGGAVRSLLESSGARLSDAQVARYAQLFTNPAHCAAALGMMNRWNLPALARDAAGLQVPFVAYAGERDLWVPLQELATQVERIPGATLVRVPNVGHLLPEEAPELVVEAVKSGLG